MRREENQTKSLRFDFPRSLLRISPRARSGSPSWPRGGRQRSRTDQGSIRSSEEGAGQDRHRRSTQAIAPARPRRPREAGGGWGTVGARLTCAGFSTEGIGDVLHHPLRQHRHLFTRLGHVGGGRGGSGAPPGKRRAARREFRGGARVRRFGRAPPHCRGRRRALPGQAAGVKGVVVNPASWGVWSPTSSSQRVSKRPVMLQIHLQSYLRSLFYTFYYNFWSTRGCGVGVLRSLPEPESLA